MHMAVSEESANKKLLPLVVDMCCASKGCMSLMSTLSHALEHCA